MPKNRDVFTVFTLYIYPHKKKNKKVYTKREHREHAAGKHSSHKEKYTFYAREGLWT